MIVVKNTKQNRTVHSAISSFAAGGMYFDEEFITELLKVANGLKSSEELRQEVIRRYTKE